MSRVRGWQKVNSLVWELTTFPDDRSLALVILDRGAYKALVHFQQGDSWIVNERTFSDIGPAQEWARAIVDEHFVETE